MKPQQLLLRCYAERQQNGEWFAICLDLNLAAQADTQQEVKNKLHAQIGHYVREAITVDAEYADQLLQRKAPLFFFARYYWLRLRCWLRSGTDRRLASAEGKRAFMEPMPLVPA